MVAGSRRAWSNAEDSSRVCDGQLLPDDQAEKFLIARREEFECFCGDEGFVGNGGGGDRGCAAERVVSHRAACSTTVVIGEDLPGDAVGPCAAFVVGLR